LQNVGRWRQRKHYFEWFRYLQKEGKDEISFHGGVLSRLGGSNQAAESHRAELVHWFKDADAIMEMAPVIQNI